VDLHLRGGAARKEPPEDESVISVNVAAGEYISRGLGDVEGIVRFLLTPFPMRRCSSIGAHIQV